jgi:subtilisin family serine protease
MARDREHFQLPVWEQALPRRRKGGGAAPERDRRAHGQNLLVQAQAIIGRLEERRRSAPLGINPKFVFKLQLNPKGSLDEEQLTQMGLRLLARDSNRAIVVFPDKATLGALRRRIGEYAAERRKHNAVAAIDAITELTPDDRTGPRLGINPLRGDESVPLDIELWHAGNRAECSARLDEVEAYLRSLALRVTDRWIGDSLCLMRARVNQAALSQLLATDYVKEVDRRPEPTFEMGELVRLELQQLDVQPAVSEDLVGIVVLDSGVMQRHPLLGPALGDAQVFPDRPGVRVVGGAEDGDERTGGHGTAVAGIAIYNDVGECITQRRFEPSARLFSARVTDNENRFDEEELAEHQLERAVEYFLENYPAAKVINISLGDDTMVCAGGRYQFRLAATVDELAYRHRDREIIFVVSAGNYTPEHLDGEDVLTRYPGYLLDAQARIINPGTAALAVTVGGISYGAAGDIHGRVDTDTDRLVAGQPGWPAPFTRSGRGFGDSVKPEFVEFAGDLRFERGTIRRDQAAHAGIPTTAKNFAPPDGRLFRTVAGTSYAAPRVANLAVRLFREFPAASSNLIRALMAASAEIPSSRPPGFGALRAWDETILRVYGYGQPDFARARWSASNEVLLLEDRTIEVDSFQLYTIPSLPEEFLTERGAKRVTVNLAFDPPTRHTRGDSYFGVGVEFAVFRNTSHEAIADAVRVWSKEEGKVEGGPVPTLKSIRGKEDPPIRVELDPGPNDRKKSTLQRGILQIGSSKWQYDGNPLILAIICKRKWAPENVTNQRFAVVVSIEHESPDVRIHEHVRQQARLYQRVRVQV